MKKTIRELWSAVHVEKENRQAARNLWTSLCYFVFRVFPRVVNIRQLNRLTPRVKPWRIHSFLTFDSMDRTLKCDHSLESC